MRVSLCLLAAGCAVLGALAVDYDASAGSFALFAKTHGRKYASSAERDAAFENYKRNVARIAELNLASAGRGARYAVNQFTDLSEKEFRTRYLMSMEHFPRREPEITPTHLQTLGDNPPTFDWRDKGVITAVKNQGGCGSCWAFSATEGIESALLLAGKAKENATTFALSPQEIVDCTVISFGCGGGSPQAGFNTVKTIGGIETIADYPYTGTKSMCMFNSSTSNEFYTISRWASPAILNEQKMMTALVNIGPMSLCMATGGWDSYAGGVMLASQCTGIVDHCVQLVGYNTSAPVPYWIVRNSWGAWGDNSSGYIFLEMWKDTCLIATFPTIVYA